MYYVNHVKYDEDSVVNQRIKKLFLAREVQREVTQIVEYVFDTATNQNAPPFTEADATYQHEVLCPHCGEVIPNVPYILDHTDTQAVLNEDAETEEELFCCSVCGMPYATEAEATECCVGTPVYRCAECGSFVHADEYDELSNCSQVVQEWWAVSKWLCQKLEDRGEVVIPEMAFWGRCNAETPLPYDRNISAICRELGILEGQEKDWSVHLHQK